MKNAAAVERAKQWASEAQWVVALTGAGISTGSGIPDFLNPSSCLW